VGNELLIYKDTKTKYKDLSANQVGIDIDKKLVYSVRQDDNLSFIANKFDVTIEDIKIWNNIDIERPLQPGQKLTIVVNVINSQMK
jgi:membrane-bound lytic murein transglycosylase D